MVLDARAVAGVDYEATEVGGPGFWVLDARAVTGVDYEATVGGGGRGENDYWVRPYPRI